jgi:hypothetical protein
MVKQEPVAWGWYDLEIKQFFPFWDEDLMETKEGCIPLYTEPKELSDEEIIEIGNAVVNLIDSNEGWIEFARAILKKASEK